MNGIEISILSAFGLIVLMGGTTYYSGIRRWGKERDEKHVAMSFVGLGLAMFGVAALAGYLSSLTDARGSLRTLANLWEFFLYGVAICAICAGVIQASSYVDWTGVRRGLVAMIIDTGNAILPSREIVHPYDEPVWASYERYGSPSNN